MTKKRGRPPGRKKISYATRLNRWLVAWLREQENAAQTIESAIIAQHKLKPPKEAGIKK